MSYKIEIFMVNQQKPTELTYTDEALALSNYYQVCGSQATLAAAMGYIIRIRLSNPENRVCRELLIQPI